MQTDHDVDAPPLFIILLVVHLAAAAVAETAADAVSSGGRTWLVQMGAKLENSGTAAQLAEYEAEYAKLDVNHDGFVNATEFAEHDNELTRYAGDLVLDRDVGGIVMKDEFLLDRVINAEAEKVFQRIDGDAQINKDEFIAGSALADPELAARVFVGFDVDGDGILSLREFISVRNRWARTAPVEARLIAIQDTYTLPKAWQSEAFRTRILAEQQSENLPASPKVQLVLEIHNCLKINRFPRDCRSSSWSHRRLVACRWSRSGDTQPVLCLDDSVSMTRRVSGQVSLDGFPS
ncbi:MAG: EF-hand domain-containing protein [Novipirellula sp. JB048]